MAAPALRRAQEQATLGLSLCWQQPEPQAAALLRQCGEGAERLPES